jgi:ankyrin repeat protein
LFYCVEKNFKEGVEILLSYNIDINPVDTYGKTALDYAYEKNLFDILDILIRAGGSSADTSKSNTR